MIKTTKWLKRGLSDHWRPRALQMRHVTTRKKHPANSVVPSLCFWKKNIVFRKFRFLIAKHRTIAASCCWYKSIFTPCTKAKIIVWERRGKSYQQWSSISACCWKRKGWHTATARTHQSSDWKILNYLSNFLDSIHSTLEDFLWSSGWKCSTRLWRATGRRRCPAFPLTCIRRHTLAPIGWSKSQSSVRNWKVN